MTTVKVKNEEQTCRLAKHAAALLNTGDVVYLRGTLGVGKTAFARAFIKSVSGSETIVPSPTFTLVQQYEGKNGLVYHHYDLYRIPDESEDDIIELGWEDSLETAITLVEWPERLGNLAPHNRLEVAIEYGQDENQRLITITPFGALQSRNWNFE